MNIGVIGATGYVGHAVVNELSTRGHRVSAFARHAQETFSDPLIEAVDVDVHAADFGEKLKELDAVVSAFSPGWSNPHFARDFTAAYHAILVAVQAADVPYLLIVGGAGSLYVAPEVELVDTADFPAELYAAANAERRLYHILRERRDINWAFLAPPARFGEDRNAREPRTGRYRLGDNNLLFDGDIPAGIALADLAVAIADDVEQKAHLHRQFTVAAL